MKLDQINTLGLSKKTLAETEFDHVAAISLDEFHRPSPIGATETRNHRVRAIERLITQKLPFHTNCNLAFDIVKQFVQVTCPYCRHTMTYNSGGGNSSDTTSEFRCPNCKAEAFLTLPNDVGLSFTPKEEN